MMVTTRTATVHDIPSIVAFWEVAGGPTRTPPTATAVDALLRADPYALIIAEHETILVGSVVVGWDGWRCHLYRLAVAPPYRRTGIGAHLLEAATTRAKAIGASRIDAMVDTTNHLGTAFWDASPFALDELERRWTFLLQP